MNIFIITSNYFYDGLFGTYSTILRARKVIETYFNEEPTIVSYEDIDDFTYKFTATDGKKYIAKILYDHLDAEFEAGMVKEDE